MSAESVRFFPQSPAWSTQLKQQGMDSVSGISIGNGPRVRRFFHPVGFAVTNWRRGAYPRFRNAAVLLAAVGLLSMGCSRQDQRPKILFTQVPVADRGGPDRTEVISGKANGAKPGQRVVLYALANRWYVQPIIEAPFTAIQADNGWTNRTHLGSEYAALLVEPEYQPALQLAALPPTGHGVLAVAVSAGRLRVGLPILLRLLNFSGYDTWWFRASMLLAIALVGFSVHWLRMYQMTRSMNARFEERLAERTRIAQELHDTLLQGFLSASMQVDLAEDQLSDDSPAKPMLQRALQLMSQVTEEGRNVIRGLRLPYLDNDSVEEVFSTIGRELASGDVQYGVVTEGSRRPLRPAIRDEVYRIGREALANAFQHAQAAHVELELEYANSEFRLLIHDDGCGIDPAVLDAGRRNHWGLPGMLQHAESIGGELKLRSRLGAGTEVELVVPGAIAYQSHGGYGILPWTRRRDRDKTGRKGSEG